jgi:hypothetical protein
VTGFERVDEIAAEQSADGAFAAAAGGNLEDAKWGRGGFHVGLAGSSISATEFDY